MITLLDELHRTLDQNNPKITQSYASWTADVPKSGVGVVNCYQSRELLAPNLQATIATTARQKFFLGGAGPEDARDVEAVLGYEDRRTESRTRAERGLFSGVRRANTVSEREENLPRVRAEEIRETEIGHALVRLTVRGKLRPHVLLKTYRAPDIETVRREFGTQAEPQGPDQSRNGGDANGHVHDWGRSNRYDKAR